MASSLQKISGVRNLLLKLKENAESVRYHYSCSVKGINNNKEVMWIRDSQIDLVEELVISISQEITGEVMLSDGLWKKANVFATNFYKDSFERYRKHKGSVMEGQRLYFESEENYFKGIVLWVGHTNDYLNYLEGYVKIENPDRTHIFTSEMDSENKTTYDIAISFAGEDRNIAKGIAEKIRDKGFSVFYDEYEQSKLWGRDLYIYLSNIYQNMAKYCLVIISKSYSQKLWTKHELKSAQARAFTENREYILPLRLDDTELEGILPTTGYINFEDSSLETISNLLEAKIMEVTNLS